MDEVEKAVPDGRKLKGEVCRHVLSYADVWWIKSGLNWTQKSGKEKVDWGRDAEALQVASNGVSDEAYNYQWFKDGIWGQALTSHLPLHMPELINVENPKEEKLFY